ncbi:MAG: anthranilate phosphoribosyltransferase [Elusimicrobiota bacterium]
MLNKALKKLAAGRNLSPEGMEESMDMIMSGQATSSQIGAFISLLRLKGETVSEITQAVRVMRDKCSKVKTGLPVMDTCSTGGTGINHFNVSTTIAFIVAGAGVNVAKHGNRAVSGRCGSADVLEELGVNINLTPGEAAKVLENTGICFMYAPVHHKAMKYAAGPRKELGIRTIFNIIGPLTNPADAEFQQLGVYKKELVEKLARVLNNLDVKKALVVHGEDGLDEITLSGKTFVSEVSGGRVKNYHLTPSDFGLKSYPLKAVKGGDKKENARILKDVLEGQKGAYRDYILANSASAFYVFNKVDNFKEGVKLARKTIDKGKALEKLKLLIEKTGEFK